MNNSAYSSDDTDSEDENGQTMKKICKKYSSQLIDVKTEFKIYKNKAKCLICNKVFKIFC